MPVVTNTVRDAAGNPIPFAAVKFRLVAGGAPTDPGYLSDSTLIATHAARADENGVWSAELLPNDTITPVGNYYEVSEIEPVHRASYVSLILVPSTPGPHNLTSLLVAPPAFPPSMGINQDRVVGTVFPLTGGGDLSVDRLLAVADATTSTVGVVQLAGDLAGTAAAPTVVATHLAAPLPVAQGGTEATTAAAARTSLGVDTTSLIAEGSNLYYTDARVRANRLDQLAAPTGPVSMGSQRITSLAEPSGVQDAATRSYVDVGAGMNGVWFNRPGAAGNSEIFFMRPDGTGIRQLTSDANYQSWWPKIDPSGTRMLFLRTPVAQTNYDADYRVQSLWMANVDGSNPVQVLAQGWQGANTYLGTPNWMPSGRDILFFGGANALIYTVPAIAGGTPVNIPVTGLTFGATDTSPSPDGTELVFCFVGDVWRVPITGGAAARLTTGGLSVRNTDPNYSFDGATVLVLTNFAGPDGGHPLGQWGLRTVQRDGTGLAVLLNDGNVNSKGCWSPDGYIYFHRFEYGVDAAFSLAKIRADGTGSIIRLTNGSVRDYMPEIWVSRYPRVPTDHASTHLQGGSDAINWPLIHGGGTTAARPAASAANNAYLYTVIDGVQGVTPFQSNASTWIQIAAGVTHHNSHLNGGTDAIPWTTIHDAGAASARPAASVLNAGYLYLSTDLGKTELSSGASWLQLGAPTIGTPLVLSRSGTPVSVVNSTTETILFSQTIVGGAANQAVPFYAAGNWLNNTGGSVTYRWRLYLGGVALIDSGALGVGANANRGRWTLTGYLYIANTGQQYISAHLRLPTPSTASWQIDTVSLVGEAPGTVDMSTNPALVFTVQLGTANALADFYCDSFYINRIA